MFQTLHLYQNIDQLEMQYTGLYCCDATMFPTISYLIFELEMLFYYSNSKQNIQRIKNWEIILKSNSNLTKEHPETGSIQHFKVWEQYNSTPSLCIWNLAPTKHFYKARGSDCNRCMTLSKVHIIGNDCSLLREV